MNKLQLHDFNNLTKTLSFNNYSVCYAPENQQRQYIEYIDETYNSKQLTRILKKVALIIGAEILNIAHQDYAPQGASVTMLIAESADIPDGMQSESPGLLPDAIAAHLDKSHITVHTYPESHPNNGINTFRADIDISTCGCISPLNALNYLLHRFDSDIVMIDYRVRGFTRDVQGKKHFIDQEITSIRNYIAQDTQLRYQMIDANIDEENIFHTKMLLRAFNLEDYLFEHKHVLSKEQKTLLEKQLKIEMAEIFRGKNAPGNMKITG